MRGADRHKRFLLPFLFMARLPVVSGKEVIQALKRFGFSIQRIKASHVHLAKATQERVFHVTIPIHGNQDLPAFVLHSILKQAGLTPEELKKQL